MEKEQESTQVKTLNRITSCVAFLFNTDYNGLRGFNDEGNKFACAYLAKKLTGFDDGVISTYFRTNVGYMRSKFEDIAIQLEIDDDLVMKFGQVQGLWKLVQDGEMELL